MAVCPRCKEDMPILSKICPVCGYVDEGGESEGKMSVTDFVQTLEARLAEIKYIPEPSFMKGMGHFTYIIYPILAAAFLMMALISEAGMFWIAFGLLLILAIVALIRKSKGTLGYAPFNRWFKVVQNDFEYHERIAKQSYGKNREISTLIDEISGQIKSIEQRRSASLKRNTLIWSVIAVLLLGVAYYGVTLVDNKIQEIENTTVVANNDWKKGIEEYKTMDKEASEAIQKRQDIVKAMLTSDNVAEAEDFFVSYCMGNMKDYDCALSIVEYYKGKQNVEAAKKFIEKCSSLRYKSDKDKLTNLITQ